ncbi:hypothetical protein CRUP_028117, partial [Coryphaenoides rupestris]
TTSPGSPGQVDGQSQGPVQRGDPGRVLRAPTGQPPGALLHAVPRVGGRRRVPAARARREDPREQAGAGAEAEHRVAVLVQPGAPGALPAPAAGQA